MGSAPCASSGREVQEHSTRCRTLHARCVRYPWCNAMLAPTQVLSMLKSTPIILP